MQGIQNLFRQHALDKQSSAEGWHSSFSKGRSISSAHDSSSDLKTAALWNQGMCSSEWLFPIRAVNFTVFLDRVLDQLNVMSSPQPVPNIHTAKSPSQEISNGSRWKRSSPDPNKMMLGRSPNVNESSAKRILSTTPSRRNSNLPERVGSPSLSGYSVRELWLVAFRTQ